MATPVASPVSESRPPRRPRALIVSDPPGAPTGLGGQARILVEAAQAEGYDCRAIGFVVTPRRRVPPPLFDAPESRERPDGSLAVDDGTARPPLSGTCPYYEMPSPVSIGELTWAIMDWEPDIILTLSDLWAVAVFELLPDRIAKRSALWVTADGDRFPTEADRLLTRVGAIVTMAQYGTKVHEPLRGRVPLYEIPHAVKPELSRLTDAELQQSRVAIRRALGREDAWIALHVGRNQYRKMQPLLLEGWARFIRGVRGAEWTRKKLVTNPPRLLLHTEPTTAPIGDLGNGPLSAYVPDFNGWNLPGIIQRHYADVQDTIQFSQRGAADADLGGIYAAADAFVLTSNGEGFGVPSLEAQACGLPLILADNTTSPEILGVGNSAGMEMSVGPHHEGFTSVAARAETGHAFETLGYLIPCPNFTIQGDSLVKRPLIDPQVLANAFREAWLDSGRLGTPEAIRTRRAFAERTGRYAWSEAVEKWRGVIRDVAERAGRATT